jgi:beta-galactosidase
MPTLITRSPSTIFLFVVLTVLASANAPRVYEISLAQPPVVVQRGKLDLGGGNNAGGSIAVNSFFLEQNGRPFVPVVGEFHYSRYPAQYWEEELRKIKAGGVTIVATYVFWNMHERKEGEFDWSGDLDLRRFIELAQKCGLQIIVRVGPFGHGEIRNGGLPDWIYGKPFEVRSNDPGYLQQVELLYAEIAKQLTGLYYKDGGPIVGIQLENEFQHSAAPWENYYPGARLQRTIADRDADVTRLGVAVSTIENKNAAYGSDHMVNLKMIAKRHGMDVPIYTATGWGNAAIVPLGSIPVSAGYAYPFWTEVAEPSRFYLFTDLQKHPDYSPVSYEVGQYPSIAAELGSGMCPNYARRSYVPEASVAPMIVRALGSGCNGVGYYMYHGGATPVFGHFYNEDASGLPKINYDYQAPIGQYGLIKSHYRDLNLLHQFLASYGDRLAPLPSIRPAHNDQIVPSDTKTLRFAARAANGSGFIFLLNYQDHVALEDLKDLQLQVSDGKRALTIPTKGTFTLKAGESAILPINLDLNGSNLRSATVQPLTILHSGGRDHYIFFSIDGLNPELVFESAKIEGAQGCKVTKLEGATVVQGPANGAFSFSVDGKPVLVLPRELARLVATGPGERLLFSSAVITKEDGGVGITSAGAESVEIQAYPALSKSPVVSGAQVKAAQPATAVMSAFTIQFQPIKYSASLRKISAHKFVVHLDKLPEGVSDVYMQVDYVGDTAQAFIDGQMIDDDMYYGRPWIIGLKRFAARLANNEMVFVFREIQRDASCLRDIPAEFQPVFPDGKNTELEVRGLRFTPEYRASLILP